MSAIEVIVIIFSLGIVLGVIGNYIYKKIKHLPTSECACCKHNMARVFKRIKKEEKKEAQLHKRCDCSHD